MDRGHGVQTKEEACVADKVSDLWDEPGRASGVQTKWYFARQMKLAGVGSV